MKTPALLRTSVALALCTLGVGSAANATDSLAATGHHCVVTLHPVGVAAPTTVECFGTLAELVVSETQGRYRPSADDNPDDIIAQLLALFDTLGTGESIIGIGRDYDYIDESVDFKAANTSGCTTGYSYEWPAMPNGWNDKLDQLETYTGCIATAYEHENFGGAALTCTCTAMGVMEDEVSSIKFYRGADSASGAES